ncbi:MAG: beta-ketoacyl-[acyl-carrier-protein] synthase family protein [Desulfobacterales bacterium]|nr:beta-ketoacyl-[acyl-carrier-protein] synthase family protein [Desulfobacterales bacterium]
MTRRVVITSVGVISSLGFSQDEIIENLKQGSTSFKQPSFDREVVVSPVKGFNIKNFTGRFKDARYLNRGATFCVAAAANAIRKADLSDEMQEKAGLFVGSGPNFDIGGEFPEVHNGDLTKNKQAALWILKFLPNTAASVIAKYANIHGENTTIGTACSASLQAIGDAFRKIKDGYLDLAFAGGGDSRINSGGILAYKKARALYTGEEKAKSASRPFDENRNGFVPGEGGAFFLLEDLEHAKKRKAPIFAEVCGFGCSIDGHNMTAPHPYGIWAEKAVRSAIKEADILPSEIDVVSTHGTGTLLNDAMESAMIESVFEEHKPEIIALKSWIGHLASSCGAVELAICLSLMKNNYLPEIRNLANACNRNISFVRKPKSESIKTMLIENFGFGGQNSTLIIKDY